MVIKAVFENGVLRPLEPLDFPEQSEVELEVLTTKPVGPDGVLSVAAADAAAWDKFGRGLLGPLPDDFKTLGDEWAEYVE